MKTERREGLGENVVLSGLDFDVARDFLATRPPTAVTPPFRPVPLRKIVADLEQRGFV